MMVRFATTCDAEIGVTGDPTAKSIIVSCDKRSPEWEAWPRCRCCDAHCCPEHVVPGTLQEADFETPATCVCPTCREAGDE